MTKTLSLSSCIHSPRQSLGQLHHLLVSGSNPSLATFSYYGHPTTMQSHFRELCQEQILLPWPSQTHINYPTLSLPPSEYNSLNSGHVDSLWHP